MILTILFCLSYGRLKQETRSFGLVPDILLFFKL